MHHFWKHLFRRNNFLRLMCQKSFHEESVRMVYITFRDETFQWRSSFDIHQFNLLKELAITMVGWLRFKKRHPRAASCGRLNRPRAKAGYVRPRKWQIFISFNSERFSGMKRSPNFSPLIEQTLSILWSSSYNAFASLFSHLLSRA
jgi:hypothetical protein